MLSTPMADEPDHDLEVHDARARILDAATKLITEGGVTALTTRAVASAASVQAPTLYRLFGEKRGLLDAVADHALASFVAQKTAAKPHLDPVQDLSEAWDNYVAFGLANPAVFAIMNEVGASPSPAATAGISILRERVTRVARAGRLAVPVDQAVSVIHAIGVGTVMTLLATAPKERDETLSRSARNAAWAAILSEAPSSTEKGIAPLAVALSARLDEATELTPGERLLLAELLARLASTV